MSNLVQRSLSGLLLVTIIVAATISSVETFYLLCWLIGFLCCLEYLHLLRPDRAGENYWLAAIPSLLFALVLLQMMRPETLPFRALNLAFLFMPALLIYDIYRSQKEGPFRFSGITLSGVVYTLIPLACLAATYLYSGSTDGGKAWHIPLAIFILLWSSDTGAYVFGRMLGRNKLLERISPGKTIEGFIGGLITAMAAAWLISTFYSDLTMIQWLIMGFIVAVTGVFGDLAESRLKRFIGVKDSGNSIPGHGGFLDRFDSLLFAAPIVYVYLMLLI